MQHSTALTLTLRSTPADGNKVDILVYAVLSMCVCGHVELRMCLVVPVAGYPLP